MKRILLLILALISLNACCQKENNEKWESEKQNQILGNEKVVENLKKNGDKFIVARDVFHWIYFKSKKDMMAFIKEVEKENFTVVAQGKIKDKFPFELQIKRLDKADIESVNQYTLHLWELAQNYNGDYDGWETSVEK